MRYLGKHNKQFAHKAQSNDKVFLPCPNAKALAVILSMQEERISTGGSEISFEGTKYQLIKGKEKILMRKGEKITVLRSVNGALRGILNGEIHDLMISPSELNVREKPTKIPVEAKEKKKNIPVADHPWRTWNKKKSQPDTTRLAVKTAV